MLFFSQSNVLRIKWCIFEVGRILVLYNIILSKQSYHSKLPEMVTLFSFIAVGYSGLNTDKIHQKRKEILLQTLSVAWKLIWRQTTFLFVHLHSESLGYWTPWRFTETCSVYITPFFPDRGAALWIAFGEKFLCVWHKNGNGCSRYPLKALIIFFFRRRQIACRPSISGLGKCFYYLSLLWIAFFVRIFFKKNGFSQPRHGIFQSMLVLFFSNAGVALEQMLRVPAREEYSSRMWPEWKLSCSQSNFSPVSSKLQECTRKSHLCNSYSLNRKWIYVRACTICKRKVRFG